MSWKRREYFSTQSLAWCSDYGAVEAVTVFLAEDHSWMCTGSKCDADMGFESSKSMRGRSSTLSQLGSSEVIELWSKSANKSSVDFAAFCPVPCPDRRRDWGLDHETVAALEAASLRPRDGTCGRNSFKSSL